MGQCFCDSDGVLVFSGTMDNEFILDLIKLKSKREDLVLYDTDTIW